VDPQEVAFVVGGSDEVDSNLASVERYDASSGAWREVAPMATARALYGLCKMSDGEHYATGGVSLNDVTVGIVERYDPCLDTWSAAPPLPRPRSAHCFCAVDDALYVLGGFEEDGEGAEITVSSVLKFNSRTQTWSEVAPMPGERFNAGVCVLGGDVYIFGGKTDDSVPTSTSYRFNTETDEWATLAPMSEVTNYHSVCVLEGLIYVIGGVGSDGNTMSSVHRFDPVANSWSEMTSMFVARAALGSFVLGGNIYAVGGFDGEDRLSSTERYSVASDSWSEVDGGELRTARSYFGVLVVRSEGDFFDSLSAKAKSDVLRSEY
jgi:kelch-like protein 17 (actinfilin)/kelch-like protein 20